MNPNTNEQSNPKTPVQNNQPVVPNYYNQSPTQPTYQQPVSGDKLGKVIQKTTEIAAAVGVFAGLWNTIKGLLGRR